MKDIQVNISYCLYPEGDDFESIETFQDQLSKVYDTRITTPKTDAMGGGLYEIVVEIINQTSFADIAKDLIEDSIKAGLVYFWEPLFSQIKALFSKNQRFRPDIEAAKFIFRDVEIIIYPLYEDSISEVIDDIIKELAQRFSAIKAHLISPVRTIHIPIFNQVDSYEVCAYRVRLNIDENISKFDKADYFKFWGVRDIREVNYVYNLANGGMLHTKFYTQSEYDELLDRKFESES